MFEDGCEEEKESTQLNIRTTKEQRAKFKEFCEENGYATASQALDGLLLMADLDNARMAVPAREKEIDEFERATKVIADTYLRSIEYCESAENRARDKFAAQLESKDKMIADLQVRLEAAEMAEKSAQESQIAAEQARIAAEAKAEAAEQTATDKTQINQILSEQLEGQKQTVIERDRLREDLTECRSQNTALEARVREVEGALQTAEEQAAMRIELAEEKASRATENAMREQLRAADKENALLQARIEQIQKQIDGT